MDHVAIMKKSWGLIPKILNGRKTIESRWGKVRSVPWGRVAVGDKVYFKNSGEAIYATATVSKVLQFDNLTPKGIYKIVTKFGGQGEIAFSSIASTLVWAKNKRYCTLIFLKSARSIKPFYINKKGFGVGSAWLTVRNINSIKL